MRAQQCDAVIGVIFKSRDALKRKEKEKVKRIRENCNLVVLYSNIFLHMN